MPTSSGVPAERVTSCPNPGRLVWASRVAEEAAAHSRKECDSGEDSSRTFRRIGERNISSIRISGGNEEEPDRENPTPREVSP